MAQQVTEGIKTAILQMKLVNGSNEDVGKLLGISKVSVGKILAGKTETIRTGTWEGMIPAITPYLKNNSLQLNESQTQYTDRFDRLANWLRDDATEAQRTIIVSTAEQFGFT